MPEKRGKPLPKLKGIYTKAEWRDISEIVPYEKNPKKHPPEQVREIANAIKLYKWDQPIVVDKNNVIIKGHGRHAAAQLLKLDKVPVVRRMDLTAEQVQASRLADNQTAESYWKIAHLLREMEILYGMDADLTSTGYSLDEIRTLCPGMLETEEDYVLESAWTGHAEITGADGLIGQPLPQQTKFTNHKDWLLSHERILVPFTGDKDGLAAVVWLVNQGVDRARIVAVDTAFGPRMWKWHKDYMDYIAESLGITIEHLTEDKTSDWLADIKNFGFPTAEKPWCCIRYRTESLSAYFSENPERTVIVYGTPVNAEGKPVYRFMGELESGARYCAPYWNKNESLPLKHIEESGLNLNPLYKVTDLYLCPGCPVYSPPDYAFLKEHDEDLWIRWMVYVGQGFHNDDYFVDGLNTQLIRMIGDRVEPRDFGTYRELAQELPDCPQPLRRYITTGDSMGFTPDEEPPPDEEWLDKPKDAWYEPLGYSEAFIAGNQELADAKAARGDKSDEEYFPELEKRARLKAAEDGIDKE